MKIIQVAYGFKKGDGVGNVVLEFDRIIKGLGYDTEILGSKSDFDCISDISTDVIFFYHMSGDVDLQFLNIPYRKILVFHNISYPELFAGFDDNARNYLAWGWYEVGLLNKYFEAAIVFSDFSRRCLIDRGWESDKIELIPLPVRFEKLKAEPNPIVLNKYNDDGEVNILFAGRISPNKMQEDIIDAFYEYKRNYCSSSKLFLVGGNDNLRYMRMISKLIDDLGLKKDIIMPGLTSFADYVAYYSIADLFLCMSAHEGFCIPLVEAMYFNVPIVAVDKTAVRDTLGDSGVLLNQREPEKVASAINDVISDGGYASKVIAGQRKRLNELEAETDKKKYEELFSRLVKKKGRIVTNKTLIRYHETGICMNDKDLSALEGNDIVICGAGNMGVRLRDYLFEELKDTNVVLCDSNPECVSLEKEIISIDDAVKNYASAIYLISVQNRRGAAEIYAYLNKQGISKRKIKFYDNSKVEFI